MLGLLCGVLGAESSSVDLEQAVALASLCFLSLDTFTY